MPNALRAPSLEAFEKDKGMQSTYALPGLACLLCLLACSAFAADVVVADDPLEPIPSDVTAVADRQIQCREWMTLEITDEGTDRAAELALTRLRCDRLAADMTSLRNKYPQSPATLHAFDVAGISGLDGMLARAKAELEGLRPLVRGSYAPSDS